MSKKNTFQIKKGLGKFLFLFALVITLLSVSHTALALEVTYPVIPGFPNINGPIAATATSNAIPAASLPQYISYFFGVAIVTAGVLGVFSIVIAGLGILFAFGNPSAISDARERIFGSILGIILLMLSFVILQTINPALVGLTTAPVSSTLPPGPFLIRPNTPAASTVLYPNNFNLFGFNLIPTAKADSANLTDCSDPSQYTAEPAAAANTDTSQDDPGFTALCNYCGASNTGPNLIVETFDAKNFTEDSQSNEYFLPCGKALDISGDLSYEYATEAPGVFLYAKPACQGSSTGPNPITGSGAPPGWIQNNIQSARIINGNEADDIMNGFVLMQNSNGTGACSKPIVNYDQTKSIDDPTNTGQCFSLATPSCSAAAGSGTGSTTNTTSTNTTSDTGGTTANTTVSGCTNPAASNYDSAATVDDGSCIISGCTDPTATNYNASANQDDGSCTYPDTTPSAQ